MQNIFRKKYLYKNFLYLNYFIVKFIMAGISNQNLLNFAEGKTNDDIKKKFVGVFPSNFITKFITFHRMMNEKGTRYPFIIMNTIVAIKKVRIGGVFLTFILRKKYFYLTASDLMVLKTFFCKMLKKLLIKLSTELKNLRQQKKTAK